MLHSDKLMETVSCCGIEINEEKIKVMRIQDNHSQ
jgi:hypothetical protein